MNTSGRNRIKPDTVLKNFWRDNARFADLFNAALFDGESVIQPDELEEVDTDISSLLKVGGHVDTLQRVFDVAKKSTYGVDFVILGLENQQHIHLGMPLRVMMGDALGYYKEYGEIVKKNKERGHWDSTEEFLSGFRRPDRLHPMLTICVYYGEKAWDGPLSLKDMLDIPEKLQSVVNDYRMNLIQVRESERLRFRNEDVHTVFEVSRNIFKKDYGRIEDIYRKREIDPELGLVIGTITESKEIINHALERKGGRMNMCTALEELKKEGIREGEVKGIVKTYREFGASKEAAAEKLQKELGLGAEEAEDYVKKYW